VGNKKRKKGRLKRERGPGAWRCEEEEHTDNKYGKEKRGKGGWSLFKQGVIFRESLKRRMCKGILSRNQTFWLRGRWFVTAFSESGGSPEFLVTKMGEELRKRERKKTYLAFERGRG